jgi:aldehyde:ferredoxin oxidoreductase
MAYTGKILIADLTSRTLKEQVLEDRIYRDFIGGVGLGVRLLYEHLPENMEPLHSQNILGFMPGLLGGTSVPSSSRLTVVGKSPLTGGWGDANVGGYIGYEIKRAGYDGILFFGASVKPVYLLLYQGKAELCNATHLWGKDTIETEDILRAELGDNSLRVACIGQAGEKLSLIASIITEKGRAAARSGLGAVMGAKRLKAIAVKGHTNVPVADSLRVRELQRKFIDEVKNTDVKFIDTLKTMGTAGSTEGFIVAGATPIQNWTLNGKESIPSDFKPYGEGIAQYLTKRGTCARCPIGCKGTVFTEETGECNSPEYETIAAFGPLCLNNDIKSIIRAGDICNRYGIDTISVGNAIAFAIECYQEGIISRKDTGGIALAWNDPSAMIAMLQKIVNREL